MKLQYTKPYISTIKVEMTECLLDMSFEIPYSENPVDGFNTTGSMEKFIHPIWGDEPSADQGDILSPW